MTVFLHSAINIKMRATEFIRSLLDLIDSVDSKEQPTNDYEDEVTEPTPEKQFSNSPDELYTDEKVLFSIGNDVNKPKHPADIRVSTVALYPDTAFKG